MESHKTLTDEIESLRRCLRDLVALTALPAIWTGREPRVIAEGLAGLLLSTLWLDLVYLSVRGPAEEQVTEVARSRRPFTADQARQTGRTLLQSLDGDRPDSVQLLPDPTGEGSLCVAAFPIGHNSEWGRVVVGSRREDFPTEMERLLVGVGANQAVISLQEAIVLATVRRADEQKARLLGLEQAARAEAQRLNAELEERVTHRTAELQRANAQLKKSQEDLRRLSSHQQAAREEERTRIAREIHDVLGGALTGLKMDVAAAGKHVNADQAALLARLQAMSGQIDDTIQTVRRMATDLRPSVLDDLGLVAAIEWQLEEFQARAGIPCLLVLKLDKIELPPDQAIALFRIFQEALTNVARHANATQVNVGLEEDAGTLVLQVRDNGRGITPQERMGRTSLGLLGMRERVRLLGGELTIDGASGQGTCIVVRIPLPQARDFPVQSAPESAAIEHEPGSA